MRKVFEYLKPYLPRISVGLLIKFTGTIMDLALPWILSYMIDDIVPLKDVGLIFIWGTAMIVCAVIALVTNIAANRMASWVAQHTTQTLRHDLFSKISYLSCKQIDDFSIPSLESRLTTDTYNIHQMIGMMQRLGIRAPAWGTRTHSAFRRNPRNADARPAAFAGAHLYPAAHSRCHGLCFQKRHSPLHPSPARSR